MKSLEIHQSESIRWREKNRWIQAEKSMRFKENKKHSFSHFFSATVRKKREMNCIKRRRRLRCRCLKSHEKKISCKTSYASFSDRWNLSLIEFNMCRGWKAMNDEREWMENWKQRATVVAGKKGRKEEKGKHREQKYNLQKNICSFKLQGNPLRKVFYESGDNVSLMYWKNEKVFHLFYVILFYITCWFFALYLIVTLCTTISFSHDDFNDGKVVFHISTIFMLHQWFLWFRMSNETEQVRNKNWRW